ncbi:adenylate/guanylate cyclase domain-containing protein [Acinetobacter sp. B5B]|uniref:adenylate/guanylate cyclase domain-containing protein n=1 Tax=Acinetobacter baretiae TaxID=2605383 RepID=UPI0018C2D83A|nr:adenylate/guanylate cyclase domain-containing protein [Acinetobacter baretiae]MBF7682471.1 adenylate/guanylate cyclase domain-containing protein [Acinetobacter baretiae]MBF7685261.1 adenylate/guanylate cyclase domain-containing protein [Acinetobacter baretiae]
MLFERISMNKFVIESIYRAVGYLILSVAVFIYYANETMQLVYWMVPIASVVLLPVSIKTFDYLKYKVNEVFARQLVFVYDVIVAGLAIASVHFSLVFSFLLIICLLFIGTTFKASFITLVLISAIGITTICLASIFAFGFDHYFNLNQIQLILYSFFCFLLFLGSAFYFYKSHLEHVKKTKHYYQEQMDRYILFSTQLSRYAPKQLWQSIMSGETEAKIDYKRKKMTIFFSDIQGFTELAENLPPEELAFLLNDYLDHMTEIAKKHEATLDKFIGDGILIFFGDPHSKGLEPDAKKCIEMALMMRQQMHVLRERWLRMGFPELHIRMGVSTGYCHVGNYGSDYRMSYTVIGHDVNLASRLQAVADVDEILIADSTYHLIKDYFICIPKQPMQLKGMNNPMNTWQVLEKYTGNTADIQQWFDYNYKGFHLLLNLEEIQHYEHAKLIQILEKMTDTLKMQKEMTTSQGVAKLTLSDELIEFIDKK